MPNLYIYFPCLQIESVAISKTEPLWTVNFKRALAAQLQLQLDGASGVFHKDEHNSYYAENTVYYTMEVLYQMHPNV
jgi:hypothetical protein